MKKNKPNVFAFGSYIGTTGYANHTIKFFSELSKLTNLKVRNFTVGKGWGGQHIDEPHNNEPYIDIEKVVDEIVDSFYWFDRKLFNLYRKKFHSIRKLSAATNISHVVVWRTINNCIKEIKKKINEK